MPPPVAPAQMQTELKAILASSAAALPSAQNLNVSAQNLQNLNVYVDGNQVVVLQGTVGTEDDRKLVEGMVRLTPGVQFVRNEIQVLGR